MVVAFAQIIDVLLLALAGLLARAILHRDQSSLIDGNDLLLAMLPALIGWIIMHRLESYSLRTLSAPRRHVRLVGTAAMAGAVAFAACSATQQPLLASSLPLSVLWFGIAVSLLAMERVFGAQLIAHWCAEGRLARRIAVVGSPAECARTVGRLTEGPGAAVDVVGTYTYQREEDIAAGDLDVWERRLAQHVGPKGKPSIDAVVVAVAETDGEQVEMICTRLAGLAVDVYVAAPSHISGCRSIRTLGNLPAGLAIARPLSGWQMLQKDIFDRLGALAILILVWPVFLVVAIAVRLDSPGPALFRQQRTGFNNHPFTCFKFRTMYHRAQNSPVLQQAVRGDQRVTRVGRWLRKTSIDELPQLLNVLRGEMSLVGPRPHAPNTTAGGLLFREIVSGYDHRHRVKPGITGWAQVNGSRGETPDPQAVERRVELDMFYIRNWSLMLDINILFRTVFCLIHDPLAF